MSRGTPKHSLSGVISPVERGRSIKAWAYHHINSFHLGHELLHGTVASAPLPPRWLDIRDRPCAKRFPV